MIRAPTSVEMDQFVALAMKKKSKITDDRSLSEVLSTNLSKGLTYIDIVQVAGLEQRLLFGPIFLIEPNLSPRWYLFASCCAENHGLFYFPHTLPEENQKKVSNSYKHVHKIGLEELGAHEHAATCANVFVNVTLWNISILAKIAEHVGTLAFDSIKLFLTGSRLASIEQCYQRLPYEFIAWFDTADRTVEVTCTAGEAKDILYKCIEALSVWGIAKGDPIDSFNQRRSLDQIKGALTKLGITSDDELSGYSYDNILDVIAEKYDGNFLRKIISVEFAKGPERNKVPFLAEYVRGLERHGTSNQTMQAVISGRITRESVRPKALCFEESYAAYYSFISKIQMATYKGMASTARPDVSIVPVWPLDASDRILSAKSTVEHVIRRLSEEVGPSVSWLDLGCGGCEIMNLVSPRTYGASDPAFVGVDSSEGALKYAELRRHEYTTLINESVFDYAYRLSDDAYDIISCFEFLEHIDDPLGLIRHLYKKTRNYLIIGTPLDEQVFPYVSQGHIWSFGREGLVSMLEEAGFKTLISKESYVGLHNTTGHNWATVVGLKQA